MLLIVVFLVAIQSVLTLWSQVGGQYHLDLMFWPWKLGITLAAATLITLIAREAMLRKRIFTRRSILCFILLTAVMALAGVVTFYYHQHEPTNDEDDSSPTTLSTNLLTTRPDRNSRHAPSADSPYS